MSNVPPTLLSNFEILFTPQSPPFGPPVVTQTIENVIKGYFLTISNPNPNAYTFNVGFHCNVNPSPALAQRTLASAIGFVDDGSTGNPLSISSLSATDFSVTVTVSANGTVLLAILPAFFTMSGLAPATIEARGWADITLPVVLSRNGRFGFPFPVPQSNGPVQVIVTAEQRLTFLPAAGDAATAVEAQSAFALPLANGASALSIPPQEPFVFDPFPVSEAVQADDSAIHRLLGTSSATQASALAALLAGAPAISAGKTSVEKILTETLGFPAPLAARDSVGVN
jgi:hypothetical protein